MKRFHIHLHVQELSQNVAFYAKLFGAEPTRVESDYANWMLTDPPVNFAISTRGHGDVGLDHLGIQADSAEDLAELKARALSADLAPHDVGVATCCYARSDKHWITDPQGIAWEHFQTLGNIPVFKEEASPSAAGAAPESACCGPAVASAPVTRGTPVGIPVKPASSSCC
jgi:hypothetical protein